MNPEDENDPRLQALRMMEQETAGEQVAGSLGQKFPRLPSQLPAAAGYLVDMFNPARKLRQVFTGNPHEMVPMTSLGELRKSLGAHGSNASEEALQELAREYANAHR